MSAKLNFVNRLTPDDVVVSMGVVNEGCTTNHKGLDDNVTRNGTAPHSEEAGPDTSTALCLYREEATEQMGPDEATLVFKDVSVVLSKKLILNKVCGMAKVGQTLAIMGPSGAGKSTLLNILGGRIPATSGLITLNGESVTRHTRRKISYVQQQDVFFSNLTLRESLTFTTYLRLPEAMPKELKLRRLQEVVDALELNKCMDTKIGGVFVTGLSGGEKKRASIACELLTNPRILMLDEPTSGLDSAIAFSLMSTLKQYASRSHKTVVTTIHQPSSQIFHMFTNILLISDGEVAYFGPGNKIIEFFSSLGMYCDSLYNPADFILEQVKCGPEHTRRIVEGAYALRFEDSWPVELSDKKQLRALKDKENKDRPSYDVTQQPQTARQLSSGEEVDVDGYFVDGLKWQTSFMSQFCTLTRRCFVQSRDRYRSPLNVGQLLFIAILVGLEWFQTDRTEERLNDRLGILFFAIVHYGFVPIMDSIFRIYDDCGVFLRERSSGIIRLSAYYLAVLTSEIPFLVTMMIVCNIIIYWMTGLMPTAQHFFSYLGILLLSAFAAQGMGFFISVSVPNRSFVVAIANTSMITFLLLGGFYNSKVAAWFYWARYVSYITYSLTALATIEFQYGDPLRCSLPNATAFPEYCGQANSTTFPGKLFLKKEDLDVIPLYVCVIVLVSLIVFFRVATYIVLRRTRVKT